MSKARIFISYRRADTFQTADRLAVALKEVFGSDAVYFDQRTIEPGDVWDASIKSAVEAATVVLVLIGKKWFTEQDEWGMRRLDQPQDWVRLEIETALGKADGLTIPVVVDGMQPPPKEAFTNLPSLAKLTSRQAANLRTTEWDRDRDALIERLESAGIPRQTPDTALPRNTAQTALSIPDSYINWIKGDFADISLLGLDPKEGQVATLRQVYVPAMTQAARIAQPSEQPEKRPESVHLLSRLAEESLYIPGAPGAGKTTFCKWLALCVATGRVPDASVPTPEEFRESFPESLRGKLPVLCRLRDFYPKHTWQPDIQRFSASELLDALAAWIDKERCGGLNGTTFKSFMAAGRTILILDGFDEVSSSLPLGRGEANPRAAIFSGLKDALPGWMAAGNRILLTSRPYGLSAGESSQLGLDEVPMSPLSQGLQWLFVQRWFATVSDRAERMASELWTELDGRDDLGPLRDNPMLLTAMCVKYQEGSRLPADITEMYDALVSYVLHNRYHKQSSKIEAARRRLGVIALSMHCGRYWDDSNNAPDDLANQPAAAIAFSDIDRALCEHNVAERLSRDQEFSALEMREDLLSNSGLLLPGGENSASFYHLSIQDFLAAERLDGIRAKAEDWLACAAMKASWRQAFRFWFGRMIRPPGSPARALRAMDSLESQLAVQSLNSEAQAALLWSDCLELAAAKEKDLGDYGKCYHKACMAALTTVDNPTTSARLFEVLGNLGLDDRPGVGLDAEGLPDILWVPVAAGRVELKNGQGTFDVPGFKMARYPVTWQQFEAFVTAADGYTNEHWWHGLDRPTEYRPARWRAPNAPREMVSWFEAVAFCRWLSHQRGQTIRLPTEEEWQLAATGGDPSRVYPWGQAYVDGLANCHDSSYYLGRTSAVGIYPDGEHDGIADLSGNVWEWTATAIDAKRRRDQTGGYRVLRGGSWLNDRDDALSANRLRLDPLNRLNIIGFRVLCSSPILNTDH